MNKRKLLTLAMTLCMVAILAIGGTLAYFTDTDSAKNVMVSGNVSIEQKESERVIAEDGSTQLTKFTNDKLLVPAVYYDTDGNVVKNLSTWGLFAHDEVNGDENGLSDKLLDQSIANEVDKIVQVHNNGDLPVYARTIFLMENDVLSDGHMLSYYIAKMFTENGGQNSGAYNRIADETTNDLAIFQVGDGKYSAWIHYYENPIEPGKTTAASLKQVYMLSSATNEVADKIGKEYTILALSQAVQTEGFTDDRAALNAAFGEVTIENCQAWFADLAK